MNPESADVPWNIFPFRFLYPVFLFGIEIGKEIGKEEGKAEGMAIGEQKGIAIAAIGMHKAGLSVELIAKSLSLAESVVLELLKEA